MNAYYSYKYKLGDMKMRKRFIYIAHVHSSVFKIIVLFLNVSRAITDI